MLCSVNVYKNGRVGVRFAPVMLFLCCCFIATQHHSTSSHHHPIIIMMLRPTRCPGTQMHSLQHDAI